MNSIAGGTFAALVVITLWRAVPGEAAAVDRDPFHPLSAERCTRMEALQQWRLKGVIGSGERWVGWLVRSESQWQRVVPDGVLPPGDWRVSRLDKSGAALTAIDDAGRCDGSPAEVSLASPFVIPRAAASAAPTVPLRPGAAMENEKR
ncbi:MULTISPECIES: HofP DNA utilization family protein [Brenneria]|uniref:HofP DNA utilization family protein n=1 Tax=Brenneria TaxID=71655 RepID=UPI00022F74A9|nr:MULTISPECIES: HofP DNA utilization family protein [Brenneria]EHD19840.1 Protein of unknown function DUF2531 [Brenneria sp. EniD312]